MFFLFILLISVISSKTPNSVPFLLKFSPYTFDTYDKKYSYTKEQLTPQQFADNPYSNSGFIKVDNIDQGFLYYVFFKHKDPSVPLVIWLQGGPGCSSMTGLFAEMGPYKIDKETLKIEENPFSWNTKYSMLFIDQPVGSGFSYVDKDHGYVRTEEEMAEELYSFLTQWYDIYPEMANTDLYIFGENAGKYVPAIAKKIMDDKFLLPLKGIGIGDGLTHPERQFFGYHDFHFATSLLSENVAGIVSMYENYTVNAIQLKDWKAAESFWGQASDLLDEQSGDVNMYDIRTHTQYDFSYIDRYLNLPDTKVLMHTVGIPFSECDSKAYEALALDVYKSQRQSVIDLLDHSDVRVLLYNAQFDGVIPVDTSINGWIREMPWKSMKEYQQATRNVWKGPTGSFYGWVKKFDKLVTCIVGDSGHLSPMNEPGRTLNMVEKFIERVW